MTDDESTLTGRVIPTGRRKALRRALAKNVYGLVYNTVISVLILTLAVWVLSDTAKNVRNSKELARDGRLAYTGDVDSGGRGQSTVYYSFTYGGRLYRGEKLLPHRYLNRISDYRKSGNFAVLFLPGDPSINHPFYWHDDESYSSAFVSYVLIAIVIVQWSAWGRFILQEVRQNAND